MSMKVVMYRSLIDFHRDRSNKTNASGSKKSDRFCCQEILWIGFRLKNFYIALNCLQSAQFFKELASIRSNLEMN